VSMFSDIVVSQFTVGSFLQMPFTELYVVICCFLGQVVVLFLLLFQLKILSFLI